MIDCCTFYNEFDILELRLRILDPYIHHFIICEADKTHSGEEKPFYLDEQWDRFKSWHDKIIRIKMSPIKSNDRWNIENQQRRGITKVLLSGKIKIDSSDILFLSDVDEIPDLKTWNGNEGAFVQKMSFYYFNTVTPNLWKGTCCVRAWRFISPYGKMDTQDIRNFRDLMQPVGYGWHFSWLNDPEKKAGAFAHTEITPEIVRDGKSALRGPNGEQLTVTDEYLPPECKDYDYWYKQSKIILL